MYTRVSTNIIHKRTRSLKLLYYISDVYDMITNLGQLKMLDSEHSDGYCSNLPYYYNYSIDDILKSGKLKSLYNW